MKLTPNTTFLTSALGVIVVTVGGGDEPCPLARKAAICITQVPEVNVAVAL
jgi:hypothetical protein